MSSAAAIAAVMTAAAVLAADPPLEPIDARREDVGPLRSSLRALEPGLAQPSGFDRVYRAPGGAGFMRIQGGLFALFPRSLYAGGSVPLIPPGTVFHIGAPPVTPRPAPDPRTDAPRADAPRPLAPRILNPADGQLIAAAGVAPSHAEPAEPPTSDITIANDPAFRARRIRDLVLRAVEAEGSRSAR